MLKLNDWIAFQFLLDKIFSKCFQWDLNLRPSNFETDPLPLHCLWCNYSPEVLLCTYIESNNQWFNYSFFIVHKTYLHKTACIDCHGWPRKQFISISLNPVFIGFWSARPKPFLHSYPIIYLHDSPSTACAVYSPII